MRNALLLLILPALFLRVGYAQDTIRFPEPKTTAAGAAGDFDARAAAVVKYNACGREVDYARLRRSMKLNDGEGEGEDLTTILIAKIQWLSKPETAGTNCTWSYRVPWPKNPDGSPKYESAQKWIEAEYAGWMSPETGCALATSPTNISEQGARIAISVTPACMKTQINEAIRAMVKNAQMGTDDLRCAEHFNFAGHTGDWDVNVRELVRILYMGTKGRTPILEQSTVDHMYQELLAARGPVGPNSYSQLADCSSPAGDDVGSPEDLADEHDWYNEFFNGLGDFFHWLFAFFFKLVLSIASSAVGLAAAPFLIMAGEDPTQLILPHWDIRVTETENHRLMIESSRFLTNADIIRRLKAEDYDNVDDIEDDQSTVREWLLKRLADIAAHDFDEYNAKPYTRYSLNAILNLYDFADFDPEVKRAAQIVLDLSAAKFAAGSNRGRRIVPFRRLADNDGSGGEPKSKLYNKESGADHEVARAMVLAGQTQLMPDGVDLAGAQDLIWAAVSSYRVPDIVLEAAVDRKVVRSQLVKHVGVEAYYQSPAFTVTAGGVQTGPTSSTLGFSRGVDRGVAVPTILIPTIAGLKLEDVYGFNGVGTQEKRTPNLCTYKGFLCGIQPQFSIALRDCLSGSITTDTAYFFVNSAVCGDPKGPHFYLAIKRGECDGSFCVHGRQWGIMEAVEAPNAKKENDTEFAQWKTARQTALSASQPDNQGRGSYRNTASEEIHYIITEQPFAAPGFPAILDVNGQALPDWATSGDVLTADGNGKATIRGVVSGQKIEIDVTDPMNPKRVL